MLLQQFALSWIGATNMRQYTSSSSASSSASYASPLPSLVSTLKSAAVTQTSCVLYNTMDANITNDASKHTQSDIFGSGADGTNRRMSAAAPAHADSSKGSGSSGTSGHSAGDDPKKRAYMNHLGRLANVEFAAYAKAHFFSHHEEADDCGTEKRSSADASAASSKESSQTKQEDTSAFVQTSVFVTDARHDSFALDIWLRHGDPAAYCLPTPGLQISFKCGLQKYKGGAHGISAPATSCWLSRHRVTVRPSVYSAYYGLSGSVTARVCLQPPFASSNTATVSFSHYASLDATAEVNGQMPTTVGASHSGAQADAEEGCTKNGNPFTAAVAPLEPTLVAYQLQFIAGAGNLVARAEAQWCDRLSTGTAGIGMKLMTPPTPSATQSDNTITTQSDDAKCFLRSEPQVEPLWCRNGEKVVPSTAVHRQAPPKVTPEELQRLIVARRSAIAKAAANS